MLKRFGEGKSPSALVYLIKCNDTKRKMVLKIYTNAYATLDSEANVGKQRQAKAFSASRPFPEMVTHCVLNHTSLKKEEACQTSAPFERLLGLAHVDLGMPWYGIQGEGIRTARLNTFTEDAKPLSYYDSISKLSKRFTDEELKSFSTKLKAAVRSFRCALATCGSRKTLHNDLHVGNILVAPRTAACGVRIILITTKHFHHP